MLCACSINLSFASPVAQTTSVLTGQGYVLLAMHHARYKRPLRIPGSNRESEGARGAPRSRRGPPARRSKLRSYAASRTPPRPAGCTAWPRCRQRPPCSCARTGAGLSQASSAGLPTLEAHHELPHHMGTLYTGQARCGQEASILAVRSSDINAAVMVAHPTQPLWFVPSKKGDARSQGGPRMQGLLPAH